MRESTLGDLSGPVVCVACRWCKRRGRYPRENLIARHGAAMTVTAWLTLLSADCMRGADRTGRRGCRGPYVVEHDGERE